MTDKKPYMKGSKALSVMVAMMFAASAVAIIFSAAAASNNDQDNMFTDGFLGEGGDIRERINFGGNGNDVFYDVIIVPDGFVAVGYSDKESFGDDIWEDVDGYGKKDAIIVKYGPDWELNWFVNFGGAGDDVFYGVAMIPNPDQGYLLFAVGYSDFESFGTGSWKDMYQDQPDPVGYGDKDAIIVAFTDEGDVFDAMNFGGAGDDVFYGVAVHEGDIFAVGYSDFESFGNGSWKDMYQDRPDPVGYGGRDAIIVGFLESKTGPPTVAALNFGGAGDDEFYGVAVSGEGMVFAVGYSDEDSFGNGDWIQMGTKRGGLDAIIVLFENGAKTFAMNFGGAGDDVFYDVAVSSNGDVFAVGYSAASSFGTGSWNNNWLPDQTKPAAHGNLDAIIVGFRDYEVLGAMNVGGAGDDVFYGVEVSSEGDVFAVGYSAPPFGSGFLADYTQKGGKDAIAAGFRDGELFGFMTFGGAGDDEFYSVVITENPNEGYTLYAVGYSAASSFGTGDWTGVQGKGNKDAIVMMIDGGEIPTTGGDDNLILYIAIAVAVSAIVIAAAYFFVFKK